MAASSGKGKKGFSFERTGATLRPDMSPVGAASVNPAGKTDANRCQVAVLAWNWAGTAGPEPSVEISAVHFPGAGSATWALP
jgi:hypothetical protein